MNQNLQSILNFIEQDQHLTAEQKNAIIKSLKDVDKELEITAFKLDRTEKVKKTTAILLEETIEELEQKRKAVEAQNRELEVESSLERVRTVALSMNKRDDMLLVCRMISDQLASLNVQEIRNIQTAIFYEEKGTYANFEYYAFHDKLLVTEVEYKNHPMSAEFANEMLGGPGKVFIHSMEGKELKDWYAFQKTTNQFNDTHLEVAASLNYYWFSLGPVALGISTYAPLKEGEIELFKRFRNVFELAYRRFLDIKQAEEQAKEARIELALERVRARSMAMQKSEELVDASRVLFHELNALGIESIRTGVATVDEAHETIVVWSSQMVDQHSFKILGAVPKNVHPFFNGYYNAWVKKEPYFTYNLAGDEVKEYYTRMTDILSYPLQNEFNPKESFQIFFFPEGSLNVITHEPLSEDSCQLLVRFARVFGLIYRRFLDLKQAEAQAKEARIEASLERVRSRAMAMQNSAELAELVATVFTELTKLDFAITSSIIWIHNPELNIEELWAASPEINKPARPIHLKSFYHPFFKSIIHAWKERDQKWIYELTGNEKQTFEELFFEDVGNLPDALKTALTAHEKVVFSASFSQFGAIEVIGTQPLLDDKFEILHRIGRVFDLSYTRFNDLKKAEAQAREAQIELALERVRARTMAMQRSEELSETAQILFQQFKELGETPIQITIGIFNEAENLIEFNVTDWSGEGNQIERTFKAEISEPTLMQKIYTAWKENQKSVVVDLTGQGLLDWVAYRNKWSGTTDNQFQLHHRRTVHVGFFSRGLISFSTHEPRPPESINLLERFAGVFDQTYTRFLDLQKSEAQAREAQIETALERVRSRTMGMQKSEELKEVIQVVYEQLVHLNIHIEHTGFIMDYKARDDMHIWLADQHEVPFQVTIPYFDCAHWNSFNEAKEKGTNFFANFLTFDEKNKFYQDLFELIPGVSNEAKEYYFSCPGLAISTVLLENVGLYIENFSGIPYTDEENTTLMRFGKVFQQTYTRFLDLQKAEAQTRESQIEASLERVRSKAMAMHTSEDLAQTVDAFFTELRSLHVLPHRCGVTLIDEETHVAEITATSATEDGETIKINGKLLLANHPVLRTIFENWKIQQEYHPVLRGTEIKEYYEAMNPQVAFPDFAQDAVQFGHYFFFKEGGVFAWTEKELSDEQLQIFRKFTSVLSLTYRRYFDLIEAESQAKEAKIEAGLERVRSRTLAMQSSDELAETAAVLFRQLIGLGIAPTRLYIGIVQDDSSDIEMWATDEDGSTVNTQFTGKIDRSPVIYKMYDGWKKKEKSMTIDMQGQELSDYFHYLSEELHVPFRLGLDQKRRVQTIAYFSKGFIGIASPDPQPEETTMLLERFASVFNLTFTRFNDLKIAEHHAEQAREDLIKLQIEKKRAEEALTELRATQTQLIHSEKMASLGELTAGIAHEIQNPLNFVNNFSEVSNELIDEMNEEISKGEFEEAKLIANDIKQNLEKINHHGKRADAIVKGMLQHSRTSSGVKEPTDINALADEYLRLAYHGLRAKDKSFNATMKTDFDKTIGNINIIPQDIGRVILNLITNAFYAVSNVGPQPPKGGLPYEPTVIIATKLNKSPVGDLGANKVEIRVKDNGPGIPPKILDKIFQPFFTTKPTGQGTGLGLSLSYDIIKAHGGEMKVETKEGEGSTFIIQLPE